LGKLLFTRSKKSFDDFKFWWPAVIATDLLNLCSQNSGLERQKRFFWKENHGMMMSSQSSREESGRMDQLPEGKRTKIFKRSLN
jgi:hypothetical protein